MQVQRINNKNQKKISKKNKKIKKKSQKKIKKKKKKKKKNLIVLHSDYDYDTGPTIFPLYTIGHFVRF